MDVFTKASEPPYHVLSGLTAHFCQGGTQRCLNGLLNAECHLLLHGVLCVGESHILCINTSFCKGPVYALTSRSVIVTLKIKYSIAGLLFTFISRFDVTPRLSLNLLIFLPHPP